MWRTIEQIYEQLQTSGNDRGVSTKESDPQYMEEKGTLLYSEAMKLMPLGNDTAFLIF